MNKFIKHFKANEFVGVCFVILLPTIALIIKKYELISAPADFANLLNACSILLGTLYGIFWFWPNYLGQKRFDTLVITTKEALGNLSDIEENVKRLLFVLNMDSRAEEQIKEHFDLSYSITQFKNAVLLLKKDETLIEGNFVRKTLDDLEYLEDIFNNKNDMESFAHGVYIQKHDVTGKTELINDVLTRIKNELLKVYDMC